MLPIKQNIYNVVVLALCSSLLADAKPYGQMLPSAPAIDSSPWVPMINAGYGSSYGSYDAPASPPAIQEPASIAVNPSVPLQTAFVPQSRPVIPENSDPNPPASQWDQPPAEPAALQSGSWGPSAEEEQPQQEPAEPQLGLWGPPAPPVEPQGGPWDAAGPASVPNESPQQVEITQAPMQGPLIQPDNFLVGPVSPPIDGQVWPETPRVVPAADNLPSLQPPTFGQFAVPPAG